MAKYKITRIYNDESDLVFKIKSFPTGKSLAGTDDIIFVIKENDNDAYSAKIIEKTKTGGQISTIGTRFIHVNFDVADYSGLTIGQSYRASCFCKWTGDTDYDENVEQIYDLEIIQDFHNEL